MRFPPAIYLEGVVCGLATATIWAGWGAVTRLAVTSRLDAWDIVALRFGVAGLLLSPVIMRRGFAYHRLGTRGLAIMIAGGGAPYVLLAAYGLHFAPAYDQGALNPGVMPFFVAVLAVRIPAESLSALRKSGFALILAGALSMVASGATHWDVMRSLGDAMFLAASFLWACFSVTIRQAKLEPLHATAVVAVGSLVLYVPIYLAVRGTALLGLPASELAIQGLFQGVLVTLISLVLYSRAIAILGASRGAAFGALVPALSALFAIPLLGEQPGTVAWVGIMLISAGVWFASGSIGLREQHHVTTGGSHDHADGYAGPTAGAGPGRWPGGVQRTADASARLAGIGGIGERP